MNPEREIGSKIKGVGGQEKSGVLDLSEHFEVGGDEKWCELLVDFSEKDFSEDEEDEIKEILKRSGMENEEIEETDYEGRGRKAQGLYFNYLMGEEGEKKGKMVEIAVDSHLPQGVIDQQVSDLVEIMAGNIPEEMSQKGMEEFQEHVFEKMGEGQEKKQTKTLERMDRREGKKLVTEALRKEKVKDEESWREWYEKRLEKAFTDITLGGKQYSYEEFKSNFEIIIGETGQKFDGLKLMEDGCSELSENLEGVTRSMWKLHCNGVATFDKRKNFMAVLDLRKGENPDGYKWYDLGANDFENFKKLTSSGQVSKAFALYLRLGTTVDSRYGDKPKDPYTWEIMIDGEIYRNPWTLDVPDVKKDKLDHTKGKFLTARDIKRIREMIVKESGSVFAENVALSLVYATDLAGSFGSRFNGGNEWGCASRRLYYPFLELERLEILNDSFKNDLEEWGARDLSFLGMITGINKVNKKGGVVTGREEEIRLMDFWLDGGFDKVDYVSIGFGGTGAQTSGFLKAAKLFDLMKAEHEGGKILSQDKLREYIDWFETAVEKNYSKEVRYRLQEDWMWDQMRKWKKDQRGTGPWGMGTVDRGSMRQIIRGAKDVGFLIKEGEDQDVDFDTFTSLFKKFS